MIFDSYGDKIEIIAPWFEEQVRKLRVNSFVQADYYQTELTEPETGDRFYLEIRKIGG